MDTRPPSPPAPRPAALARAVAAFHARQPPRLWSLIVSFLGDAVLPRGGMVQAGVISEFCGLAAVDPGLVRTALSRLVAGGTLARARDGRRSYYRLTAGERRAFTAAADIIYGRRPPAPDGRWDMLLLDAAPERAPARRAALAAGYAALGPATFLRPHHAGRAAENIPGAVSFIGMPEADAPALAATLWPVSELAAGYRRFTALFEGFSAAALSPEDALLARVLLVHEFRRLLLRDPGLPAAALPAGWPAGEARAVFTAAHAALTPGAEAWLAVRVEG